LKAARRAPPQWRWTSQKAMRWVSQKAMKLQEFERKGWQKGERR
jgi:hypothetical protein